MNERIEKLAKQAGIRLDFFGLGSCADGGNPDIGKFAELIVKECLEVVERQFGGGNGDGVEWDRAVEFTYNDMKQHFGVEE